MNEYKIQIILIIVRFDAIQIIIIVNAYALCSVKFVILYNLYKLKNSLLILQAHPKCTFRFEVLGFWQDYFSFS